eukprot:m.29648 g.29648  ORF g.29648 m.29648 type:complete len:157 (+) comp40630_c0_seq1:39-509(+)
MAGHQNNRATNAQPTDPLLPRGAFSCTKSADTPQQYRLHTVSHVGWCTMITEVLGEMGAVCCCKSPSVNEECTSSGRACMRNVLDCALLTCLLLVPVCALISFIRYDCDCRDHEDITVRRHCARCLRADTCSEQCEANYADHRRTDAQILREMGRW